MDMDLVSCKCSEDLLKDPRHDLSIKFRYQRVCFSPFFFTQTVMVMGDSKEGVAYSSWCILARVMERDQ